MRFGIVKNNVCINVIEATRAVADKYAASLGAIAVQRVAANKGWLWDGNKFTDPRPKPNTDAVTLTDGTITRYQLKMALQNGGKLADAENHFKAAAISDKLRLTESNVIRRSHLGDMATALGYSESQADALFLAASAISE